MSAGGLIFGGGREGATDCPNQDSAVAPALCSPSVSRGGPVLAQISRLLDFLPPILISLPSRPLFFSGSDLASTTTLPESATLSLLSRVISHPSPAYHHQSASPPRFIIAMYRIRLTCIDCLLGGHPIEWFCIDVLKWGRQYFCSYESLLREVYDRFVTHSQVLEFNSFTLIQFLTYY